MCYIKSLKFINFNLSLHVPDKTVFLVQIMQAYLWLEAFDTTCNCNGILHIGGNLIVNYMERRKELL